MKKFIYALSVFMLAGIITVNAQEQGKIRILGGLAYGTKSAIDVNSTEGKGGIGFYIGGEYFFTDQISAAPTYEMWKSSESGVDYTLSSINIDGRYYFVSDELSIYGLAGISLLKGKVESGGFSVSDDETGLNIGGGVVYQLSDKFGLNGQLKYQTPGDGQLVLGAGIAFSLN